jgi:GT2 family glycosyltransferase
MHVGAVVLHYRFWPRVNDTLDALRAQDFPVAHTVVVDNRSADGSADHLRNRRDIEVLEAPSNGGYAAGMNLGIRSLGRRDLDAVLLLTHEAALSPGAIRTLVDHLNADSGAGAVGPLLAWQAQPEVVYSAGVSFAPRTWSTHHIGAGDAVLAWSGRAAQKVDSLDGAAVLIRRRALEETGPFNETYFLYFEEADFFVRMRQLGWTVACVPQAMAVQQPGVPPKALWVRNNLRFLADNAPRRVLARELLRTTYHAAGDAIGGHPGAARDGIAGLTAFFSGRPAASLANRR